ncbi:MAG: DUF2071 domain-containing protein [Planctomycetia bacterium]|nr:DUF2071 domain-containing protein [Planctomycetia bacterium]
MNHGQVFLTAEWRWLAMFNWPAPDDLLRQYLPRGLELDRWQGQPYVSIVGFMFRDTRLRGWAIPGHRTFAELNLRFYVRQPDEPESRGVCFVREVVALPAVTWVARAAYNENYVTCPMRFRHSCTGQQLADGDHVEYSWKRAGRWNKVSARTANAPRIPAPESAEEYFTENYWGYTAQRDGTTKQYRVEHPPWLIWPTTEVTWDCDVAAMYGEEWQDVLRGAPESANLIEGSAINVYTGRRLEMAHPSVTRQSVAAS